MTMRWRNTSLFLSALWHFGRFWVRDGKRLSAELEADIRHAEALSGEPAHLDAKERLRLQEYLLLGAGLGEMLAVLRGSALSRVERRAFLDLSLLAPLYDDLFDAPQADASRLRALARDCFAFKPQGLHETLTVLCLRRIMTNYGKNKVFLERFERLFQAQIGSQSQAAPESAISAAVERGAATGSGISSDQGSDQSSPESPAKDSDRTTSGTIEMDTKQLRRLTQEKGGHSALLYRSLLGHPLVPGEEEVLWRFGALVQLMDDLFDVHGDAMAGVRTLASTAVTIEPLRVEFQRELDAIVGLFQNLDYPSSQVRRFLSRALLILSRGQVCLDHLEAVQRDAGGVFRPREHSFDELLCDMELPRNFFRGLRYCLAARL